MIVAVIGGTGIDEMEEFASGEVICVCTKYGEAEIVKSDALGGKLLFLPRHGRNHLTPPSQINYRAQVAALKKMGVSRVVGVCAVGSLRADVAPGSFVVMGDFIDLTRHRINTFFDDPSGPLVHTDFTEPYCPLVSKALQDACASSGAACRPGAVYAGVDGPRYESPAEIRLYAAWGGDVIGMTNLPEAVLAREAGLCYGALGIVTNLAAGLGLEPLGHDDVRAAVASAKPRLQAVIHTALLQVAHADGCSCSANTGLIV